MQGKIKKTQTSRMEEKHTSIVMGFAIGFQHFYVLESKNTHQMSTTCTLMSFFFWHIHINIQGPFGQFKKKNLHAILPCHFFPHLLAINHLKKTHGNSIIANDEGYNKSTK